jgi:hypothetical protein
MKDTTQSGMVHLKENPENFYHPKYTTLKDTQYSFSI